MAKEPTASRRKSAAAAAKTEAAPVVAPVPAVPADLAELISAATEAAITVTRTAAEAAAKPEDADAVAAAASAATLFQAAIEAIETWFGDFIAAQLAGADEEAERQLADKRAILKTQLEEFDGRANELTARRAEVEAALEALKDQPAVVGKGGGAGDVPVPITLPLELEDGFELITVIGPAAGLRRAGHLFNAVPNTVVVSAEQRALIAADPALSITDDPTPSAEAASSLGRKPAAGAFVFDPNGFTDVKVLGPRAGRRRIGHTFGPEESILRVDASDLEELLGDDQLAVGQA